MLSLGSYLGAFEASRARGPTGKGGLSPQGEWGAQEKGGRRPGTPEGDGRAPELDRGSRGGSQDYEGGTGQGEDGRLEDPSQLGVSWRCAQQGAAI